MSRNKKIKNIYTATQLLKDAGYTYDDIPDEYKFPWELKKEEKKEKSNIPTDSNGL